MPRTYVKGNGKRAYGSYDEQAIGAAEDVANGMSLRTAATKHCICHVKLHNFIKGKHKQKPGRPPVLSEFEEAELATTIIQVLDWGFGLNELEVRLLTKGYLDRKGHIEPKFHNN